MSDKPDHIHQPKKKEVPIAEPDVAGILFRAYREEMTVEDALEECTSAGAKDLSVNDVTLAYEQLNGTAKWLNEKIVPYLQNSQDESS